jgi:hypothetical protein
MANDTDGKVKIYKNPGRNMNADYKPYVPQYQVEGVEPKYHGAVAPGNFTVARPAALPLDNPRAKRSAIRQPYADVTESPIGRGRGPVPNVGNNMEHTWSSVDGDIVDDLSNDESVEFVDPNHPMVDNNDLMTPQALGGVELVEQIHTPPNSAVFGFHQNGINASDIPSPFVPQSVQFETVEEEIDEQSAGPRRDPIDDSSSLLSIVADLADESFLLLIDGTPLCSGPKEEIEEQARALVFGEHELCDGNPIPIDDIIILKRVKVKVGLFLE